MGDLKQCCQDIDNVSSFQIGEGDHFVQSSLTLMQCISSIAGTTFSFWVAEIRVKPFSYVYRAKDSAKCIVSLFGPSELNSSKIRTGACMRRFPGISIKAATNAASQKAVGFPSLTWSTDASVSKEEEPALMVEETIKVGAPRFFNKTGTKYFSAVVLPADEGAYRTCAIPSVLKKSRGCRSIV